MPAKAASKRQKAPFGTSLWSLGARLPCLATLLQPFTRGSHRSLYGETAGSAQNDVVEMLIEAGADLQLRNKEDLNAFQIANNSGHEETAAIIRERSNFVFKLFN
jgi:hypothetical protein